MQLRPSALHVFLKCSGSIGLPSIEEDGPAQAAGRERHARLAKMPEKACEAFGRAGLAFDTSEIRTEVPLAMGGISGTTDALASVRESAVLDYKGLHDQTDPAPQLRWYTIAAKAKRYVVARVDDDLNIVTAESYEFPWDGAAAQEFLAALERQRRSPPTLSVGEWCGRCSSFRVCPAQQALVGSLVKLDEAGLTTDRAAEAWGKLKAYRAALEVVEDTIRAFATEHPVTLENGRVLGPMEVARESIDAAKALAAFPQLGALVKGSLTKEAVVLALGPEGIVKLRMAGACVTKLSVVVREHA